LPQTMDQCIPERASARSGPAAIALVGFMGAGKSTVGTEIALRIGWRFLDLDQFIEGRQRKTIEQIFREQGEPAFRRLECVAVRDAINGSDSTPVVLALGGGAFMEPEVQNCLREANVPAVFLDAPVAELFRRCEQPGVERPLRRNPDQFRKLYQQRRPQYLKAQICVDTSGKPVSDVAQEIISGLKLVPLSGACD
jgi:shikimate kinase